MATNKRSFRPLKAMLVGLVAIATTASLALVGPSEASAADVSGFTPGNIIDDSLFYDDHNLTAAQIQTFLNQRVPRCTIGDPGRAAGRVAYWSGQETTLATHCLRDIKMTTQSRAANKYCKGYVAGSNETVAQIIAKVGESCEISQKVLLVLLEKEQSLIRDSYPTVLQYSKATGLNCSDSAPCDPSYSGFFTQIYGAAQRFKNYTMDPGDFNYKPFQTNTILRHPDRSCGSDPVYIQNRATAALYNYTPYAPNRAALNFKAGTGSADGCSTYGNLNFYLLYTDWFGSTKGEPAFPLSNKVAAYWKANRSWLGQPSGAARSVSANGGGHIQDFQGGYVYESKQGAVVAFTSTSPIIPAYGAAGGIEGSWGWPLAAAISHGSGNTVVRFQGGAVVETSGVGVFLVPEASRAAWEASGGFSGQLGYPTASAAAISDGTAQNFQKGNLYRSSAGSFALPNGNVRTAYLAAGGPQGQWGWPRGRLLCASDGTSCTMDFVKGVSTWSTSRGSLFTPLGSPNVTSPATPGSGEKVVGGAV